MAQLACNPDLFGNSASEVFEAAVRDLAISCREAAVGAPALVLAAVEQIDKAAALPERERGRRIEALIRSMPFERDDYERLAGMSAGLRPSSKNAIMGLLPQDLRPTVYRGKTIRTPSSDKDAASLSAALREEAVKEEVALDAQSPYRAVLLLGSEAEHNANMSLLKQHEVTVLRREQVDDELEAIIRSGVAGVVVAASIWKAVASPDHERLLSRILRLSSIFVLRIDVDGLDAGVASHLLDLRRAICCSEADAATFCHGSGCRLSPADIDSLQRAAGLLDVSARTRFHPQEIGCSESLLVRVAATKHVRGHRLDHGIRLEQIQTSIFSQGRSQAKVVMVRPDDGGPGFVMKVDDAERLRAEMQKYYKYISRWAGRADPELYFHGEAAAIIFSLVDSPDAPGAPAPTLDEQVEKALNGELGDWGQKPPCEEDLIVALERTVTKLATLNRQPCGEKGLGYGWMAETIRQLDKKGIVWDIKDSRGASVVLRDLVCRAADVVKPWQDKAVVHGDVHLMNVLLRDNRDPILIDYALSGPGHPCFDVARLEAAVLFRCFRAVSSEARISEFMGAIALKGASYDALSRDYPDLLTSVGNRLAARTAVLARKQCIELLAGHGGKPESYYAMKLLVSASALTMLQPQSAISRATISALAPILS